MGTITDRLSVSNTVFNANFPIDIKARSQFQNQTRYWINILPNVAPTACLVTVWYTPVGGTSIAALDANGSAITINLTAPKPVYIDGDVSIITLVHSGLTAGSMTSYGVTVAVDTGGTGQSSGGTAVSSSNPLPVNSQLDSKTSDSQAALEGILAKCWINCPAVAAKFSAVQIWNPVGSGVNLLIIGLTGMNASTTMKWFQHLDATKISTLGGHQRNLKVGRAALPIEMYYQALDAKTPAYALGVNVSATTPQGGGLQMVGESICIPEGYGLRYEADTANISITMFATIIASSNT